MSAPRTSYDLVIAGGGPAGCAAAISAKRACPSAGILLLEKGAYPRHKVCGEFISPEALALLHFLIEDEAVVAGSLQITRARLLIGRTNLGVDLRPPAISLARYELDALLWSAAQQAGVECVNSTVTQVVKAGNGFHVHLQNQQLSARAVINATGRWSNLSGPAPLKEKWIGLKAHFGESFPTSTVDLYFFRGGYCGVQPVGTDSVNACAMVRADVAKDLDGVLRQHPELQRRSRSWTPLTEMFATAPLVFRPPRTTHDGTVLVGDAAGFIDPFLGDGISLALRSGTMAGEAVADFCSDRVPLERALARYESTYRRHLAPLFRRASSLRRVVSLPAIVRTPLINLARFHKVGQIIFKGTRHKVAA
jgi:menaquinone-9 beta-reductase